MILPDPKQKPNETLKGALSYFWCIINLL